MGEAHFPSGQWVGFYTYPGDSRRHLMDLLLEFRDGVVSGEGADGIGFFAIDGRYDPRTGECTWIKAYFGAHSVDYTGYREKKGIWGLWTIGHVRGGFHIWPLGEAPATQLLATESEATAPALSPGLPSPLVPVPLRPPAAPMS